MVNWRCILLFFVMVCAVMFGQYVDYIAVQWDIYVQCCRDICYGAYANDVKSM